MDGGDLEIVEQVAVRRVENQLIVHAVVSES